MDNLSMFTAGSRGTQGSCESAQRVLGLDLMKIRRKKKKPRKYALGVITSLGLVLRGTLDLTNDNGAHVFVLIAHNGWRQELRMIMVMMVKMIIMVMMMLVMVMTMTTALVMINILCNQ